MADAARVSPDDFTLVCAGFWSKMEERGGDGWSLVPVGQRRRCATALWWRSWCRALGQDSRVNPSALIGMDSGHCTARYNGCLCLTPHSSTQPWWAMSNNLRRSTSGLPRFRDSLGAAPPVAVMPMVLAVGA